MNEYTIYYVNGNNTLKTMNIDEMMHNIENGKDAVPPNKRTGKRVTSKPIPIDIVKPMSTKIKLLDNMHYILFIDSCKEMFMIHSNVYYKSDAHTLSCAFKLVGRKVHTLESVTLDVYRGMPVWLRAQIRRCILFRYMFCISKPYLTSIYIDTVYMNNPSVEILCVYSVSENKIADDRGKAISDKYKTFFDYDMQEHCRDFLRKYSKQYDLPDLHSAVHHIRKRIHSRVTRLCPDKCAIAEDVYSCLKRLTAFAV